MSKNTESPVVSVRNEDVTASQLVYFNGEDHE